MLPKPESYGEKKLIELVDYAVDQLKPGPEYALKLVGVEIPMLLQKEMEAYLQLTLDSTYGANLSLFFDQHSSSFMIETMGMKLNGQNSLVDLIRTERLGYVTSSFVENSLTSKRYTPPMPLGRSAEILKQLGVDPQPPTNNVVDYKTWLSNLLSSTKGWQVIEQVQIPTELNQHDYDVPLLTGDTLPREGMSRSLQTSTTFTISNSEVLPSLDSELIRSKKISKSLSVMDGELGKNHRIDSSIEVSYSGKQKEMSLYNQGFLDTIDPFVINNTESVEYGFEKIILDENSYESFRRLVEEAEYLNRIITTQV